MEDRVEKHRFIWIFVLCRYGRLLTIAEDCALAIPEDGVVARVII